MSALLLLIAAQISSGVAVDARVSKCALGKLKVEDARALGEGIVAGALAGKAPSAKTEQLLGVLRGHGRSCETRPNAQARAGTLAAATVAVEALSGALQGRGADVIAINARLARTPTATLDAFMARQSNDDTEAFRRVVLSASGKPTDPTVQTLAAAYVYNAVLLGKIYKAQPK